MNLLLLVGVATINASPACLLVAGFAALVAGTISMAAGEHLSVPLMADADMENRPPEQVVPKVNRVADDDKQIFSPGVTR